ncbi:hypothetical protein GKKCFE_00330 [Pseudomonas sp. E141]|nr:hypothetical protein SAMN05216504_1066 [Pseudomonas sp. A214]
MPVPQHGFFAPNPRFYSLYSRIVEQLRTAMWRNLREMTCFGALKTECTLTG